MGIGTADTAGGARAAEDKPLRTRAERKPATSHLTAARSHAIYQEHSWKRRETETNEHRGQSRQRRLQAAFADSHDDASSAERVHAPLVPEQLRGLPVCVVPQWPLLHPERISHRAGGSHTGFLNVSQRPIQRKRTLETTYLSADYYRSIIRQGNSIRQSDLQHHFSPTEGGYLVRLTSAPVLQSCKTLLRLGPEWHDRYRSRSYTIRWPERDEMASPKRRRLCPHSKLAACFAICYLLTIRRLVHLEDAR